MNPADDFDLDPVHGRSVISVTHAGEEIHFSQVLQYDYIDASDDCHYHGRITTDPAFHASEIATLKNNMQAFLDAETNTVNGSIVPLRVTGASIGFRTRPELPFFTWLVTWHGKAAAPGTGVNVYEARVEPATLEYDVQSIYLFPPGARVVDIESSLSWTCPAGNVIVYTAREGDRVDELERVSWTVE